MDAREQRKDRFDDYALIPVAFSKAAKACFRAYGMALSTRQNSSTKQFDSNLCGCHKLVFLLA